jgi:hypothetical protein
LVLNLTPGIQAVLENLLTIAGRLEDNARIVDHLPDDWHGDLDEFRRSFYEPLRDRRSGPAGQGDNFNLDLQDAALVFDVVKGIDDGWMGGTPWKVMSPAERSAVDRFLEMLRRPNLGEGAPVTNADGVSPLQLGADCRHQAVTLVRRDICHPERIPLVEQKPYVGLRVYLLGKVL